MKLFPSGLAMTPEDVACIQHHEGNVEDWILSTIREKIRARKKALLSHWTPIFFGDPALTVPATEHEFLTAIFNHPNFQDRATSDAAAIEGDPHFRHVFAITTGSVKLFLLGIDVDDIDAQCVSAFIIDFENWVRGAVLGMCNRGKKKMQREWMPKLLADPEVIRMPQDAEELVRVVIARDDYRPLKTHA